MIHAQDLAKTFRSVQAVDGFSFHVEPGEIYGLLGPNGAGKTTTTRMLACLIRPTSGSATVAGFSIREEPDQVRRRIGILTETPGLYLRLTPLEYLDFFARVHELPPPRRTRIEESLRLVDMWDRRSEVMRGFSKGMQQRVAIARTLLHQPDVLFFDEPTAALDPEAARHVRDHLLALTETRRCSVLLCTHNLLEAEQICDRLSIVRAGRQIAEGTIAQLKAHVERSVVLRARAVTPDLVQAISVTPGVASAAVVHGAVVYRTTTPDETNPAVVRAAVTLGADVLAVQEKEVSLEEVYLSLVRASEPPASLSPSGAPRLPSLEAVP